MYSRAEYEKAYELLVRKKYMTYADMYKIFKDMTSDQIKLNFDNQGFFVYDDCLPVIKPNYSHRNKYAHAYAMMPIIRPCKDMEGKWIA